MGLVEDIGQFIAGLSTAFTLGQSTNTSVYLNALPSSGNSAISVIETGGIAPARVFTRSTVAWENARVQVSSRSTASTTARNNMDTIWTNLEAQANSTLSGTTYLRISAVQSPFLLERDEQNRFVFAANFDVQRRP